MPMDGCESDATATRSTADTTHFLMPHLARSCHFGCPARLGHFLVMLSTLLLVLPLVLAQPDPCTAIVSQLGLECQAFWIDLPMKVEYAIYSTNAASELCTHHCLQPAISAAVQFMQQGLNDSSSGSHRPPECDNYKDIGYIFSFLSEFGCLLDIDSSLASQSQYCISYVGSSINAFNVNRTVSLELCDVLQQTGCCYDSFVNVEIPAIALGIVKTDAIVFIRNLSISCALMGRPLSEEPCQGGATDVCQEPFDEIAYDCLEYSLSFPQVLFSAMQNATLNAELCETRCYNSTIKLAQILIDNRMYLAC
jgi:hypothetical protein